MEQSKLLIVQNEGGQDSKIHLGNVQNLLAIILRVGARNVFEFMADEAVNVHAKTMKYYLLSNSY